MEKKIYQVEIKHPETKEWVIPNDLFSFQVFGTNNDAEIWVEKNINPMLTPYRILEYNESDIEDYQFVKVKESIYHLYCGWEEKHYGSSDPATHDCSVLYSFREKETAQDFLKEEIGKTIEQIKDDLDMYDYEFDEDNLTIEKNEDYGDSCKVVYRTEWVKFEYNLFIQEGELL